jgi:hypothetical protein
MMLQLGNGGTARVTTLPASDLNLGGVTVLDATGGFGHTCILTNTRAVRYVSCCMCSFLSMPCAPTVLVCPISLLCVPYRLLRIMLRVLAYSAFFSPIPADAGATIIVVSLALVPVAQMYYRRQAVTSRCLAARLLSSTP